MKQSKVISHFSGSLTLSLKWCGRVKERTVPVVARLYNFSVSTIACVFDCGVDARPFPSLENPKLEKRQLQGCSGGHDDRHSLSPQCAEMRWTFKRKKKSSFFPPATSDAFHISIIACSNNSSSFCFIVLPKSHVPPHYWEICEKRYRTLFSFLCILLTVALSWKHLFKSTYKEK